MYAVDSNPKGKAKVNTIIGAASKAILNLSKLIVILTSITIVLLIFIQVLLRYVFLRPLLGTEELAAIVVMWLWFFAMAYSTHQRFHVHSEPPIKNRSFHRALGIVSPFFCLFITVIFGYYSYQYAHWTYVKNLVTSSLGLPLIIGVLPVFIGLVITAGYFVRDILNTVRR